MRIVGILLLILGASCAKPYRHAGDAAPLQVAGIYTMSEKMYSSDCPPSIARSTGVEARTKKINVEVANSAPSTLLLMRVNEFPFDGQVLPNGEFELRTVSSSSNIAKASYKQSAKGRFSSTGFSARYVAETTARDPQTGAVRACKFIFTWEAEKL